MFLCFWLGNCHADIRQALMGVGLVSQQGGRNGLVELSDNKGLLFQEGCLSVDHYFNVLFFFPVLLV